MTRRGFTLIELLIGMTVFAILGVGLARILLSDARFVSSQEAMMYARQTSRAARNALAPELRMVGDGGLAAAAPESVTVRVPYAFGMTCRAGGSGIVASLMPPDSLMYASAAPAGMAVQGMDGTYSFLSVASVGPYTDPAPCDADSVRVVPGGRLVEVAVGSAVASMQIFYLYQTVTYRFGDSAQLPGRVGLWRGVNGTTAEELVAPFDTSARFAFLVGPHSTVEETPPADLSTVRGLELRLAAQSVLAPQGRQRPETFRLVTQVPFINRLH